MTTFIGKIRRARRHIRYLSGYLDFSTDSYVPRLTDFARCPRPVLLLYGFFSTRRTFEVLERRLRRDGYSVFSLDLGGVAKSFNTRGIDDLADFVRAKVERLSARNPAMGRLTLTSHYQGG